MTPLLRNLATAAAIVLVAGVWLHFHDNAVRKDALATVAVDSLNTAMDSLRRRTLTLTLVDSTRAESIAVLNTQVRRSSQTAHAATARADSLSDLLSSAVPDTLRPIVAALDSTYHVALAQKDSVISAYQAQVVLMGQQIADRDSLIHQYQAQLDAAIAQRNGFRAEAHPGFFTRAEQAAPFVAGALAVKSLIS